MGYLKNPFLFQLTIDNEYKKVYSELHKHTYI